MLRPGKRHPRPDRAHRRGMRMSDATPSAQTRSAPPGSSIPAYRKPLPIWPVLSRDGADRHPAPGATAVSCIALSHHTHLGACMGVQPQHSDLRWRPIRRRTNDSSAPTWTGWRSHHHAASQCLSPCTGIRKHLRDGPHGGLPLGCRQVTGQLATMAASWRCSPRMPRCAGRPDDPAARRSRPPPHPMHCATW